MHGTQEIIQQAAALPGEGHVVVVDLRFRALNPPDAAIDRAWVDLARRRMAELRSGQVQEVPGEQVFARIREQLAK